MTAYIAKPIIGHTVTAIVQEFATPLPPIYEDILIYTVKVSDPRDANEILIRVAEERAAELDSAEPGVIEEIRGGLRLIVTFPGDVPVLDDHRGYDTTGASAEAEAKKHRPDRTYSIAMVAGLLIATAPDDDRAALDAQIKEEVDRFEVEHHDNIRNAVQVFEGLRLVEDLDAARAEASEGKVEIVYDGNDFGWLRDADGKTGYFAAVKPIV